MHHVYQEPPSSHLPPNLIFAYPLRSAAVTNNGRAEAAPMELPDINPLVEDSRKEQTSHLRGSWSFQQRAELASRRLIDGASSATPPPHQQPAAQEAQSRARRGAFYDPVRDIVLLPPDSSPVAADSVLGNTLSDDGNVETVVATGPRPNLSEPSFHNMAGNNTQFAVPHVHVEIDPTTASNMRLSDYRRPSTSVFRQTSATAVETDQYRNHSQVRGSLAQTPPQPVSQVSPPNAPRASPIPRRITRLRVPAMYKDMIGQESLLRQSNAEEHEQVREAASYGFTTTLQSGKKRFSNAALSPPPEAQEEPSRKKLHNRGGARPGAGRPATKMLRQLASETAQQSLRAGNLWDRPTSAISPYGGGGSGHAVNVSGTGSLPSSYSGFPLAPSADPHIQPSSSLSAPAGPGGSGLGPGCAPVAGALYITGFNTGFPSTSSAGTRNQPSTSLSATVGPSYLSRASPSRRQRCEADGADIGSVNKNLSAPASASFAVSVAASVLEILARQEDKPPRLQPAALEKVEDAEGGKGDDASGDVKKEEEKREEQVVEHKPARNLREGKAEGLRSEAALPKSKAEETRGAKEPESETQAEGDEKRQAVTKGTEKGNGKRKANAITPLAERAAEEPAKDEPPAKRAKTAAMSSPAVSKAPVRRSARLQKTTAKARVNMLE